MNRSASDWPAELRDVTDSHPTADQFVIAADSNKSVFVDAEITVVEDGLIRRQSIGNIPLRCLHYYQTVCLQ